jgi:hypothetical protein
MALAIGRLYIFLGIKIEIVSGRKMNRYRLGIASEKKRLQLQKD